MDRAAQQTTPAPTRAALAGLGVGAAASSFFGVGILAGFVSVALAVGVFLALGGNGSSTRVLKALAAGTVVLFPLAVAAQGEEGILVAAAGAFALLAGGFVLRGRVPGALQTLAVGIGTVLHLGLLGSYLVLVAGEGNRLLPALVLMAAAFEAAYLFVSGRRSAAPGGKRSPVPEPVNLRAAAAGVMACQAAALLTRLFLPARLSLLSLVVLGTVVAGSALLGHASGSVVRSQPAGGRRALPALDPSVPPLANGLLFAAGAFYYGFRLYLT